LLRQPQRAERPLRVVSIAIFSLRAIFSLILCASFFISVVMTAISTPAIQRYAAAAPMPYVTVERMTRPLIAANRWPNRFRKRLLAGDMASLMHAMLGGVTTEAVTSDTLLRGLEYQGTWPPTVEQVPALGEGRWGELLERLIANAPAEPTDPTVPARVGMDYRGYLPHSIEVCLNPASISLVWLGRDGVPARRDHYGPAPGAATTRDPYGPGVLMVRKVFLDPRMITIAGEILRDISRANAKNETAASLPGEAAAERASLPGPTKIPSNSNTRESMRAPSCSQGKSHVVGPGPLQPRRPPLDDYRQHPNSVDSRHERVAGAI
jgi:hypothetical protein